MKKTTSYEEILYKLKDQNNLQKTIGFKTCQKDCRVLCTRDNQCFKHKQIKRFSEIPTKTSMTFLKWLIYFGGFQNTFFGVLGPSQSSSVTERGRGERQRMRPCWLSFEPSTHSFGILEILSIYVIDFFLLWLWN